MAKILTDNVFENFGIN